MPFAPESFLKVAEALATKGDEASHRTAVGRAYYAVYGYVTKRMADARGVSRSQLFKGVGRHKGLAERMALLSPFNKVVTHFNSMRIRRGNADYVYKAYHCSAGEAERAVKEAQQALATAKAFSDTDYKNLPVP